MFGKRRHGPASVTVIAAGTVVEGTVKVRGLVQIDGSVEGTLKVEGHVSVGPEGRVMGDVVADDLSVAGKVEGTILARGHLHVLTTGVVRGESQYASLEVDRGGVVDGRSSRVDDKAGLLTSGSVEVVANVAAE